MSRTVRIGLLALVVAGSLVAVPAAFAHDCPKGAPPDSPACRSTPPYGGWRPNWIPLFDVPDRQDDVEGEAGSPTDESRRTYQRWRDEYGCSGSMCVWFEPSLSAPGPDGAGDGQPRSVHTGIAADHTWLEGFHQSEGHVTGSEGTHDGHGGTVYADVCLAEDTHDYGDKEDVGCDERGVEDTEVGVVVVDHLGCTFGCQDEYHVVRPFDAAYTQAQLEETPKDAQYDAEHPDDWLCGYDGYGDSCPLPDSE